MIRLLTLPVRLAFRGVRLGWVAGRTLGPGRVAFFGVGFAAGVWVASPGFRRLTLQGALKGAEAVRDRRADPAPAVEPLQPAAPSRI